VWLYVMANMIVFGSALNWQLSHGRTGAPVLPRHDETPPAAEPPPPPVDPEPAPATSPPTVEARAAPATPPPP
jgi:hypothetical protein